MGGLAVLHSVVFRSHRFRHDAKARNDAKPDGCEEQGIRMTTVRLVHWNADEAMERIERLQRAGFRVQFDELNPGNYRKIRQSSPDVMVIDLGRLPSHGREVARYFRDTKATSNLPVVFAGGADAKVERAREEFPDAEFAPWSRIKSAVNRALKAARHRKAAGGSNRPRRGEAYSATPLATKLGIGPGKVVGLVAAPDGFQDLLLPLPEDVTIRNAARGHRDVTILFVRRTRELENRFGRLARTLQPGQSIWVAWPKKSSGIETDVTQDVVRQIGLSSGLVDNKICAIDATWSALRFAPRRK